jgi:hypothetical protein
MAKLLQFDFPWAGRLGAAARTWRSKHSARRATFGSEALHARIFAVDAALCRVTRGALA